MRVKWVAAGWGCSSAAAGTEIEATSAGAMRACAVRLENRRINPSEGQKLQQRADDDVRLAGAVRNGAFAFDLYFKLRNGAGRNGIVGAEIARADQAAQEDGLAIVA